MTASFTALLLDVFTRYKKGKRGGMELGGGNGAPHEGLAYPGSPPQILRFLSPSYYVLKADIRF